MLRYDPETGRFTWLVSRGGKAQAGTNAGAVNNHGYVVIYIFGKCYMGGRLAWFYMTGQWPPALIDHRDTNRANNRWGNLREASSSQNGANSSRPSTNTSGVKGVYRRGSRYIAQIASGGRRIYLGIFDDMESAAAAYAKAAQDEFAEFARAV
ncbi:MAG: HNH endonuclease signature motif containing protein [Beijerinckiaceae bacterium]|nr:HNH endonuclease signature motif containing protein [Beijerinckiaceae bacterium]